MCVHLGVSKKLRSISILESWTSGSFFHKHSSQNSMSPSYVFKHFTDFGLLRAGINTKFGVFSHPKFWMSWRLQCFNFVINDKIQANDSVGAHILADSKHCSTFGSLIQGPSLIIMSQGLAKCSSSIWRPTQCVGLCILFQTSAAFVLKH